jgi:hypothetical protein
MAIPAQTSGKHRATEPLAKLPSGYKKASGHDTSVVPQMGRYDCGFRGCGKSRSSGEISEKHPSGAKALLIPWALSARLKSCPDTYGLLSSFSAACKVVPFQSEAFFRSL